MAIGGVPDAHDVELYALGKGILYIAPFANGSEVYSDLGNCPAFALGLSEEKLDHFTSRSGVKRKDKVVVIETGYSLEYTLDEFSVANLAYFLKANTSHNIIYANTNLTQEYAIKFISDNPEGPNQTWIFHKATISPNGTLSLIGDDNWMEMSFSAEGLDDTDNNPSSPYFDVTFVTTTTTTTTTTTSSSSSTTTTTA